MSFAKGRGKPIAQASRLVNAALARAIKPSAGSPAILGDAIRYCVLSGGKRFRPLLCLGACTAVGGEARQALSVACAIELIHTYSLVHDDLPAMDNADERRGRPSCHRQFGEATAILVGDALLTRAFELLGSNGVPNMLPIVKAIAQASGTTGLVGGQALDLEMKTTDSRRLEEIAKRKTAALITVSVVAGGLAGRASASALQRLKRYGRRIGLAFQLIDDLHDADGLAAALGSGPVRKKAAHLIEQAKRDVASFGRRAALLIELADWLGSTG